MIYVTCVSYVMRYLPGNYDFSRFVFLRKWLAGMTHVKFYFAENSSEFQEALEIVFPKD